MTTPYERSQNVALPHYAGVKVAAIRQEIQREIEEAVAEERERCAQVAEAAWRKGDLLVECHYKAGWHSASREIADSIRKSSDSRGAAK